MLGVDEGRDTTGGLRFGDDLQRERGLAGGLGTVDLDDAPARDAADAQCGVERERTGGNRIDDLECGVLAEAHQRALAELALDLLPGEIEYFLLLAFHVWDPAPYRVCATP